VKGRNGDRRRARGRLVRLDVDAHLVDEPADVRIAEEFPMLPVKVRGLGKNREPARRCSSRRRRDATLATTTRL
jgi:hypothetical protein